MSQQNTFTGTLTGHARRRAGPGPGALSLALLDATLLLASSNMKTLYLRNVPEEVARGLEALAAREGMSVSSFAVRELGEVARRANNASLLGDLPDLGVSADEVAGDVQAGRTGR